MLKLQGTITAMVTPFDTHDNVDYGALLHAYTGSYVSKAYRTASPFIG